MQTAPRGTLATLTALLLGFGLMQMGNTFQGTLLSIRGGIEGFSPAQIVAVGSGFCFAGLFIVVESWLNSSATEQTRGKILSIYGMTGLLAGIVGQLLLPTTNPNGFRPFCIITIIIAVALVPIALTRAVAPINEGQNARIDLRALFRQSPFA